MSRSTLIPVNEYQSTSYSPDCDYIDGVVLERNLGEKSHSSVQMAIAAFLFARRNEWNIKVYPEQRVQVSPTRFRIPDITVWSARSPTKKSLPIHLSSASRSFRKTTQ